MAKKAPNQQPAVRDRDHDVYVSTVKFLNVKKLERPAELMSLLTHIVKKHSSSTKTVLVQAKTSANIVEYRLSNRRVAITMAKQVQSAFKHNHATITITEPKDRTYCTIEVVFTV